MNSNAVTANIYPSLSYDDASKAIEWLCEAFGFEQRLVVPGPDGSIVHSQLSIGGDVIMVGSSRADEGRMSPRQLPGVNQMLAVRVDNPDEHYARAVACGAEITQELRDEDFGARGYLAKDIEGHHWCFSNYRPGVHWD